MVRRVLPVLILIAVAVGVWWFLSDCDEAAPRTSPPTAESDSGTLAPSPATGRALEAAQAESADGRPSGTPPSPGETAPGATGSATPPTIHRIAAFPFEQARADGTVKIGFDDLGRLEVETECGPDRVFTVDVYAEIDGELEWLGGSDGVATLRANLEVGNRKYLTERHWGRLRTTLTHPRHPVKTGADVEVRVTYFDHEGRKLDGDRYCFAAP